MHWFFPIPCFGCGTVWFFGLGCFSVAVGMGKVEFCPMGQHGSMLVGMGWGWGSMLGVGFLRYVTTLFSVSTCLVVCLIVCVFFVWVWGARNCTLLWGLWVWLFFGFGLFLGCCLCVGSGIVPHSVHGCYVELCGCECGGMLEYLFLCRWVFVVQFLFFGSLFRSS